MSLSGWKKVVFLTVLALLAIIVVTFAVWSSYMGYLAASGSGPNGGLHDRFLSGVLGFPAITAFIIILVLRDWYRRHIYRLPPTAFPNLGHHTDSASGETPAVPLQVLEVSQGAEISGPGIQQPQPDNVIKITLKDASAVEAVKRWIVSEFAPVEITTVGERVLSASFALGANQASYVKGLLQLSIKPAGSSSLVEATQTINHAPAKLENRTPEEEKTPLDPPPTPQEIHEAEMNPWPGHTMRETILRNRGILSNEPPSMPMLQQQVAEPENQEPQPPYVSQQQDDPIANIDQSPPAPSSEPPPTSYSEQLLPTQTPPEDHPAESDQQRYNSPRGDTANEDPNN